MQIVYLSARPQILAGTIASIRAHLNFIDSMLVVAPGRFRQQFADLDLEVITDEELLRGPVPTDHQRRNFALRAALSHHNAVAGEFMMADDDSRPLRGLDQMTFFRDDRYRRYTFGWLDEWTHKRTSFDLGQLATGQILGLLGQPRRAYASHMPQMVDKAMLAEAVDLMSTSASRHPIDEWSTYFNVAPARHPDRFHEPEPYVTLGWPENPAAWQATLEPQAFLFENYFPEHYGPRGVFGSIDPDDHSVEAAIEKVARWRDYELRLLTGLSDPIVGLSQSKRLMRKLRRRIGRAMGNPLPTVQRAEWTSAVRGARRPKT
jgi:hypothetical protein